MKKAAFIFFLITVSVFANGFSGNLKIGSSTNLNNTEETVLNTTNSLIYTDENLELSSEYLVINSFDNIRTDFNLGIDYTFNRKIEMFWFGNYNYNFYSEEIERTDSGAGIKYTFVNNKNIDLSYSLAPVVYNVNDENKAGISSRARVIFRTDKITNSYQLWTVFDSQKTFHKLVTDINYKIQKDFALGINYKYFYFNLEKHNHFINIYYSFSF